MSATAVDLRAAVQDFRLTLGTVRQETGAINSVRLRLEAILRGMFIAFRDARGASAVGLPIEGLPAAHDNLDTGNAWHQPYPPYARALRRASTDLQAARQYLGPEALRELVEAARAYARHANLVPATWDKEIGVLAGTGTVQLYDALARHLIERPGDGVVVPTPTYGLFLPQIERAGGEVVPLPLPRGGRVDAKQLRKVLKQSNRERWSRWQSEIRSRIKLAQLRLSGEGVQWEKLKNSLLQARSPIEADSVLSVHCEALGQALSSLLSPPRVVAFLHINPQVNGLVYGSEHVSALAEALAPARVAVIEDLAYHGLVLRHNATLLGSFLPTLAPTYSLLGLSKPFALAGHRIGVLLTSEPLEPMQRLVESSIGFPPPAAQRAAAALLGGSPQCLRSYLDAAANDPLEGYALKRRIMLMLLEGRDTVRLSPHQRSATLPRVNTELADAAEVLNISAELCEQFVREGLTQLFEVTHDPEMGLFVLVSCNPCLALSWAQALALRTSFDVFAWAAFFCGIRTIPEEAMGGTMKGSHLLRLSLSPAVATLVRAAFVLWLTARRFEDRVRCGELQ